MLLVLLLSAASLSAVDAERDFAHAAQRDGQWTAFRAFAAAEALMFVPEPLRASDFLAGRPDPPVAVMWWASRSWVSCDGALAVNTGPWIREGGRRAGTFTTVWQRQASGRWKWLLDHGRDTPAPVAAGERPAVHRASCRALSRAAASVADGPARGAADDETLFQFDNRMPSTGDGAATPEEPGERLAGGRSADGSLIWEARRLSGGAGAHLLRAWQWDGRVHRLRLYEISGVQVR